MGSERRHAADNSVSRRQAATVGDHVRVRDGTAPERQFSRVCVLNDGPGFHLIGAPWEIGGRGLDHARSGRAGLSRAAAPPPVVCAMRFPAPNGGPCGFVARSGAPRAAEPTRQAW
jgi:hypothetical protein